MEVDIPRTLGYNDMVTKQVSKILGFSLIELLVSIAIFFMMTTLLIANYGRFDSRVLLTNLAYDVALAVRTAQTYGLSVQGYQSGGSNPVYQYPYGVTFCALSAGCDGENGTSYNNQQVILFADATSDRVLNSSDSRVTPWYNIKRGATISQICEKNGGNWTACDKKRVDITFQRPNPEAIICVNYGPVGSALSCGTKSKEVRITVKSNDNSERYIVVNKTGQISVEN